MAPYVSMQEGGVVNGEAPTKREDANAWLMGSLLSTLILGRRAGFKADLPRELSDWSTYPMVLVPSPLTATEVNNSHVLTSFWESASAYVQKGGALYASLCADAAIPEMGTLFGATLADHAPVPEVTLTMTASFGELQPGDSFHFQPDGSNPKHWGATLDLCGGQVIAVDQDGRPALVIHTFGKGKTLLCTYPIESYLAVKPAAFDGTEETHRLYRAFRLWAGVQPLFTSGEPSVETTVLGKGERGYAVLTNHSATAYEIILTASAPMRELAQVGTKGSETISFNGASCSIHLDGYAGKIIAWRRK
jgi:beta-galactosidase